LSCYATLLGQSYPGFVTGNYAGAAGVISQPASIADNSYPWDVVLVGLNVFADNNYAKVTRSRAFMNFRFGDASTSYIRNNDTKYGLINVEATGPSFMLRLKKGRAVGFVSRVRTYGNVDGLSGELASAMADGYGNSDLFNQTFDNQQLHLKLNSWQEYGITYAQVIKHTPYLKIKAGVTAKLLIENGGAQVDFITASFQNVGNNLISIPQFSLDYGYSQKMQTIFDGGFSFFQGKKGFGMDVGLEYEFYDGIVGSTPSSTKIIGDYNRQTNTVPKYKYKLGFSIVDIGRLKYTYGENSGTANLVNNGTDIVDISTIEGNLNDPNALSNALTNMVNLTKQTGTYTMGLPTAFQANVDYRLRPNTYLNANAYVNLTFLKWSDYNVHDLSNVTITPRWENNWLGFYLPFYMNIEGQFNMGLGTRIGPLVLGVHDFLPFLSRKESTSAGVYLMFKTYIPNKKEKTGVKCGPEGWERGKKRKR